MAIDIVARALALKNSSGTGKTTDYNQLSNLPLINGVQLKGDIDSNDLKIGLPEVSNVEINLTDYKPGSYVIDGNTTIKLGNRIFNPEISSESGSKSILIIGQLNDSGTEFAFLFSMALSGGIFLRFMDSLGQDYKISNNSLLLKNNTLIYTPTEDYNPATKKYVDDSINTIVGSINTVLATLTTPTE